MGIWARNSKNENWWKIPNFPNFKILGRFGLFRLVLGHFGWFRLVLAGFVLFWLVSGSFGSFRVLVITLSKQGRKVIVMSFFLNDSNKNVFILMFYRNVRVNKACNFLQSYPLVHFNLKLVNQD